MSSLPPPVLYSFTPTHAFSSVHTETHLKNQLIDLHKACIEEDHMLATFLDTTSPSHWEKFAAYWTNKFDQAHAGNRLIFLQYADEEKDEVAGVVMLDLSLRTETGPFRCAVEKLMTSPLHRKKGIAKALMTKLEEEARKREAYLLLLDTEVGSGADKVYPKLGYNAIGVIPKYGVSPKDGRLVDEIFFYKDLREQILLDI